MNTNTPADANGTIESTSNATISPTGMHRPGHCESDTEGTACLDEILHDAALRDSSLRVPR
jgi:hypothetical protein